jgi:hypothetical protein
MFGLADKVDRALKKADSLSGDPVKSARAYPGSLSATYREMYPDYLDTPHLREVFAQ